MDLNVPEVKHTILDYEFVFSSGIAFQVSVDPDAGDSIEYLKGIVHIKLAPRESLTDSTRIIPGEEHTIFLRHVASSLKKERIVVDPTKDQKDIWKKVYADVSTSVH